MELVKAIKERRSIRKFKVDPVPHEILEELLQTAMWAPSGRNTQPWKLVILTGKKKEEFLKLSNQAITAIDANLRELFNDKMRLFIHGYFRDLGGAPAVVIALAEKHTDPEVIQANQQSVAAVFYNLQLLAHEAGLGTCWMTGHMAVEKELLELIECTDYQLVAVTPIGYPDQVPPTPPRKGNRILWLED